MQDIERVDFITATTHELKTSLTAIIASAELLADDLQPEEKSVPGRLIRSIIRNAHYIDKRLSRFPKIARLLTNGFRMQLEPIEIGQVISNIAAQFYPRVLKKKQSLTLEIPDSLPLVKVDREHIEKVVLTLIANASKFTPEGGKIKASAWEDGEEVVVEVSDTGVGILAEEQELIFQPYYQVKQGKQEKHRGSGLGLAITKFLVELHEGKIWVRSVVGQGSSFFFSLPKVVSE